MSIEFLNCVDPRVSTAVPAGLVAEAGVPLYIDVHHRSVVTVSGLALLLRVLHLLAVPAFDGLLLAACAGRWLVEELSATIRSFSSLIPNGIDNFKFIVVQALKMDGVLVDVVHLGDLGNGFDHGDRLVVAFFLFDLLHLLSKAEDLQGVGFATFHNSVPELFSESSDEHLGLDEHLGGGHAKRDGFLNAGFLRIGQVVDGGGVQMGRNVYHLLGCCLVHLAVDAGGLGPAVPDGFLGLLVKVSEVGTNGLGFELGFVYPQERVLDVVPLGEVDAGKVLEASVPIIGITSEKTRFYVKW